MTSNTEKECFNASNGSIKIQGYNVHPGYAFGKMINVLRILPDIIKLFPDNEGPETTRDREGYYHPFKVKGDVNSVQVDFILRDFDRLGLEEKIIKIKNGIKRLQNKYPKAILSVEVKKKYHNMKEVLDKYPEVIKIAEEAIKRTGVNIIHAPIRGGTDGARLSFMGLPTPNIFTGGINFHSKKEFIPVFAMNKAVETILNIIDISVEKAEGKFI
ncbi:MAG: peptidase dimerization domain-containing protein [Promethearchaeota archaeon]